MARKTRASQRSKGQGKPLGSPGPKQQPPSRRPRRSISQVSLPSSYDSSYFSDSSSESESNSPLTRSFIERYQSSLAEVSADSTLRSHAHSDILCQTLTDMANLQRDLACAQPVDLLPDTSTAHSSGQSLRHQTLTINHHGPRKAGAMAVVGSTFDPCPYGSTPRSPSTLPSTPDSRPHAKATNKRTPKFLVRVGRFVRNPLGFSKAFNKDPLPSGPVCPPATTT
ncbi:hypothetical protein H4R34_002891 [Dimargaris verticillata]|uniref:Uncharacterized protein n=1 Tax=Dimargaris verticillata TaxID=2761393 RepID=A0A9W8EDN4_9FUNG|nr:hypothetical protein H4R34_002891 [Dimargaris verticillata]